MSISEFHLRFKLTLTRALRRVPIEVISCTSVERHMSNIVTEFGLLLKDILQVEILDFNSPDVVVLPLFVMP